MMEMRLIGNGTGETENLWSPPNLETKAIGREELRDDKG
jgi:hypothetical protein